MKKICQSISSLHREQNGVAIVIVALSMLVIIGFTALVVDVGGLYAEKSRLQKAVDAAVLGGAQVLKVSETEAEKVAIDLGTKNGFTISKGEVSTGSNFIEIEKTVNKDLTFARVLGFKDTDISAFARAETNTLIKADRAIPLMFEREVLENGIYGQEYRMHQDPNTRGNFGFLRIGGNGNKNLVNGVKNGIPLKVGEYENTEPGNINPKTIEAFNNRITDDNGKNHCSNYTTADNTCRRLVTVGVVETYADLNGTSNPIKIIGLAVFWIETAKKEDKIVTGRFIEFLLDEEYGGSKGYGNNGVKLVN